MLYLDENRRHTQVWLETLSKSGCKNMLDMQIVRILFLDDVLPARSSHARSGARPQSAAQD